MMGISSIQKRGTIHPQSLTPIFSPFLIIIVLMVCFSEGLGYFLRDTYNLPSPHLLGIPAFGMALVIFYYKVPGFRLQKQINISLFFTIFATFWLFLQLAIRDTAHVLGYGQAVLFIVMLYWTRQLFEQIPGRRDEERLLGKVLGTALVLHYLQIAAIVLISVAWHATGVSFNLLEFLSQPVISENYGFRSSGISREPAWAAMGLASTYLIIHYLAPQRKTSALIGFILAAWLINSGTAYLFGIVFGAMYVFEQRSSMLLLLGGIFALLAIGLMTYLQWDRIGMVLQGADPSFNMRFASAKVALEVIFDSFPIGTGYGNYRLFGVYGAEFDSFINLELITFYKSDILLLNILSELGIAGILFAAVFYHAITVRGRLMPTIIFLVTLFLFGTIIVPPLILVAAVSGILAGRQRLNSRGRQPSSLTAIEGSRVW
jgi:hypothetical protein